MCLFEIGPQPTHPTTGLPVFVAAIDSTGAVAYGSDGVSVSRWTWPGLTFIDDYLDPPGSGFGVTIDADGNVWIGSHNGSTFEIYKNGVALLSANIGPQPGQVGAFTGGGMSFVSGFVWILLSYTTSIGAEVGRLFHIEDDVAVSDVAEVYAGGGPAFTAWPNPSTGGSLWWSASVSDGVIRADPSTETYNNNAATAAGTFMFSLDNGNMLGFSGGFGLWREWQDDAGMLMTVPTCDPAALGFFSFPIGAFQNADLSIRGLIDANGIVWANRRRARWGLGSQIG